MSPSGAFIVRPGSRSQPRTSNPTRNCAIPATATTVARTASPRTIRSTCATWFRPSAVIRARPALPSTSRTPRSSAAVSTGTMGRKAAAAQLARTAAPKRRTTTRIGCGPWARPEPAWSRPRSHRIRRPRPPRFAGVPLAPIGATMSTGGRSRSAAATTRTGPSTPWTNPRHPGRARDRASGGGRFEVSMESRASLGGPRARCTRPPRTGSYVPEVRRARAGREASASAQVAATPPRAGFRTTSARLQPGPGS